MISDMALGAMTQLARSLRESERDWSGWGFAIGRLREWQCRAEGFGKVVRRRSWVELDSTRLHYSSVRVYTHTQHRYMLTYSVMTGVLPFDKQNKRQEFLPGQLYSFTMRLQSKCVLSGLPYLHYFPSSLFRFDYPRPLLHPLPSSLPNHWTHSTLFSHSFWKKKWISK